MYPSYEPTYNQVIDIADVTADSDTITEPVTLQEMKDFLRLEGGQIAASQVTQAPLPLTLAAGATTVQSNLLIGATILNVSKEGTVFYVALSASSLNVTFDSATGTITFASAGALGGEQVEVLYSTATGNPTGVEFDFDDALIEELITSARELMEIHTGRSIVPHTWKVLLTNLAGDIELPYSNGIDLAASTDVLDAITDCNGDDIDDYTLRGTEFVWLEEPLQEKMTVTYSVIPSVPKRLKQAIMRDVAFHYENRGDLVGQLCDQAIIMASKFKRVSTWLA